MRRSKNMQVVTLMLEHSGMNLADFALTCQQAVSKRLLVLSFSVTFA